MRTRPTTASSKRPSRCPRCRTRPTTRTWATSPGTTGSRTRRAESTAEQRGRELGFAARAIGLATEARVETHGTQPGEATVPRRHGGAVAPREFQQAAEIVVQAGAQGLVPIARLRGDGPVGVADRAHHVGQLFEPLAV